MADSADEVWELSEGSCYVALAHDHLNSQQIMDKVRSPEAGAIVLFAGESLTPACAHLWKNGHPNGWQVPQEIASQESR